MSGTRPAAACAPRPQLMDVSEVFLWVLLLAHRARWLLLCCIHPGSIADAMRVSPTPLLPPRQNLRAAKISRRPLTEVSLSCFLRIFLNPVLFALT